MTDRKYTRILGVAAIALACGACFGSGPDPQASASPSQHPIGLPTGSVDGIGSLVVDGDTIWMMVQVNATGGPSQTQPQLWQASVHGGLATQVPGTTINRVDAVLAVDATHVYWTEGPFNPKDTNCTLHLMPKAGGAPVVAAIVDCNNVGPPGGLVVDGNDVWIATTQTWTQPWPNTQKTPGGSSPQGAIWHADLNKPESTRTTKLADAGVTCNWAKNCLAYDGTALYWWDHTGSGGPSSGTYPLQRMTKADGKTTTLGAFVPTAAQLLPSQIAVAGNDVWYTASTSGGGGSQLQAIVGHTTTAGGGLTNIEAFPEAVVFDLVAESGQAFVARAVAQNNQVVAIDGVVGTDVHRIDATSRRGLTNFPADSIEPNRLFLAPDVIYVAGVRHVVGFDRTLFQ